MTDGGTEEQEGTTTWAVDEPADGEVDTGPRVLLLGSSESGQELAVALQRLGAEVITADADTLTDGEELSAVVAALQPDFVVTLPGAFEGQPQAAAALAVLDDLEAQDTELVPGARAVRLTADGEALRRLAADELGLPTAPFWFVDSRAELEAVAAHAGYPLLVKSVDGSGRSVVRGAEEVARAWEGATADGSGRVWAETVVDIEFLVTLIVVRTDGPSGPVIEFCAPIGHRSDDTGALESWQPQQMTTAAVDAAKSIAARIVKSLGGRGVFSVELMINGDEVYFAEVTAGPGDSAWVTLRSQRLSVFELQARAVLGVAVDTMMVSPGAARLIDDGPVAAGVAPSGDVLASALSVPESDLRVFGSTVDEQPAAVPDKWGVTLATAPEVTAARDRAREAAARLNMRDSRG